MIILPGFNSAIRLGIFSVLIALSAAAGEEPMTPCRQISFSNEYWSLAPVQSSIKGKICVVQITSKVSGLSRSFSIDENGTFQVLIQNRHNTALPTRTRHYFIYPANLKLGKEESLTVNATERSATLIHPSGIKIKIPNKPNTLELNGCEVSISSFSLKNKGGFEIKKCKDRMVFDLGMDHNGDGPSKFKGGELKITDSDGNVCNKKQRNDLLLDYYRTREERYDDNYIPYSSATVLKNLKRGCGENFSNKLKQILNAEQGTRLPLLPTESSRM